MNFPITQLARVLDCHPNPVQQEELNGRFFTWGHFYQAPLQAQNGPVQEQMRSVLELWDGEPIGDDSIEADAVVIMMNPGASFPLNAEGHPHRAVARHPLVPAEPDRTQYQVMRVMLACDWRYVRVLNLSDLREPNSAQFMARLLEYGADDSHSVFSPNRAQELAELLGPMQVPVVYAWGVSEGLETLAHSAMEATAGRTTLGIQSGHPWQFYHPLPQNSDWQRAWVTGVTLDALGRRGVQA